MTDAENDEVARRTIVVQRAIEATPEAQEKRLAAQIATREGDAFAGMIACKQAARAVMTAHPEIAEYVDEEGLFRYIGSQVAILVESVNQGQPQSRLAELRLLPFNRGPLN